MIRLVDALEDKPCLSSRSTLLVIYKKYCDVKKTPQGERVLSLISAHERLIDCIDSFNELFGRSFALLLLDLCLLFTLTVYYLMAYNGESSTRGPLYVLFMTIIPFSYALVLGVAAARLYDKVKGDDQTI